MSESFIGEIKMMATTFAPRQWAMCDGATMAIYQNQPLFALIGTQYGGDGRSSFALPDMRGRIPVHFGQGPGLQNYPIAAKTGVEEVTLQMSQIPAHTHTLQASTNSANTSSAIGNVLAKSPQNETAYLNGAVVRTVQALSEEAVESAGGNMPHNNMMPYLAIHFVICLQGIFPSRN
ncbi:phage tail protein [Pseudoalteromonas aurantia]|uniref:Phage tail protein n=1 Tax=Pseudoalteromonas aurantia TaxID=43654 RepID=A0A5S3VAC5_9GAMM|nr:tail fiber protein [Pseudoalteromonas aurantia]TMO66696.1 phage tail protein [Pseudoalteromonas aurantia]TMO68888.1 phage tail protein [Pseudoalteromonas aurantia]TMO73012.1 phage tail protein [Pseudoalteromonas aurantia]